MLRRPSKRLTPTAAALLAAPYCTLLMKKVQKAVGFKTPSGPMPFTDEDKMEAHGPPFPKKSAEATLARLRKLPGNKLCGTCRTPSTNRGGFADVVLTYRIFVCRDCRESHGVAGHEVRTAERLAKLDVRASLTPYEVEALARGGNEVNVATTFALLPATSFEWPTKRTASSVAERTPQHFLSRLPLAQIFAPP